MGNRVKRYFAAWGRSIAKPSNLSSDPLVGLTGPSRLTMAPGDAPPAEPWPGGEDVPELQGLREGQGRALLHAVGGDGHRPAAGARPAEGERAALRPAR